MKALTKFTVIFFLLFITENNLFSQETEAVNPRKGFIGIAIGPAFAMGDYGSVDGGAQLNLINFGYLFSPNLGIAGTWFGTSFAPAGTNDSDEMMGLGGMMFGPMGSIPVNNYKFQFDARLLIGYAGGNIPKSAKSMAATEMPSAFAYGGGISARWNCSKYIVLSLNYDIYSATPDFGGQIGKIDMTSSAMTFGVAYRLK